jgi:phosphohistidine phosphatase SixA
MKNIFILAMKSALLILLIILGACDPEEEPVPVMENEIISEDLVKSILVVAYNEGTYPINIETTNAARFSPHPSRNSFEIHSYGKGDYNLEEGAYWVNYHFEDEPNNVQTLPILITKNKPYAKEAIAALHHMRDEPSDYIFVLRHGHADVGNDRVGSSPEWFKSCSSSVARQMSQTGINDSKKIGNTLKALDIKVAATTASEYCRAIKTIELMEFDLPIVQDARLNHQNSNPKDPILDDVEAIIRDTASPNGIHIIVGHYNMCHETLYRDHIMPLRMGDGWIMKKGSNGQIAFVGAVPLFYWDIFN